MNIEDEVTEKDDDIVGGLTKEERLELAKRVRMTDEERAQFEEGLNGMVDNLNKNSTESVVRAERYDKVFAIERLKWPHNMGSKLRDEIPQHLQKELDECIVKSQEIAREACQTQELTNVYLLKNSK